MTLSFSPFSLKAVKRRNVNQDITLNTRLKTHKIRQTFWIEKVLELSKLLKKKLNWYLYIYICIFKQLKKIPEFQPT